MANTASLYIQQKGTGDQLYKDYFGSNPDGEVIKNFETVWTDNSPSRTLLLEFLDSVSNGRKPQAATIRRGKRPTVDTSYILDIKQ